MIDVSYEVLVLVLLIDRMVSIKMGLICEKVGYLKMTSVDMNIAILILLSLKNRCGDLLSATDVTRNLDPSSSQKSIKNFHDRKRKAFDSHPDLKKLHNDFF